MRGKMDLKGRTVTDAPFMVSGLPWHLVLKR